MIMGDEMSVLATLLSKEKSGNKKMISAYNQELKTLPKGSIKTKKAGNRVYYYLIFRDGYKVVTKYVGKDEESLISIKEKLKRRKQIEEIIKKLKAENIQIEKFEAIL